MKATTPCVLFAIVSALAFPAFSQDVPLRGPIPFSAFDIDGDKRISEEEFNTVRNQRWSQKVERGDPMRGIAQASTFAEIDTDENGFIDLDELNAHRLQKMNAKRGPMSQ